MLGTPKAEQTRIPRSGSQASRVTCAKNARPCKEASENMSKRSSRRRRGTSPVKATPLLASMTVG